MLRRPRLALVSCLAAGSAVLVLSPLTVSNAAASQPLQPSKPAQSTAGSAAIPVGSYGQPLGIWGSTNVFAQRVTTAPVDTNSPAMVADLVRQVSEHYSGVAAFNTTQYNPTWYNVSATQPTSEVAFSNCQHKAAAPIGMFGVGGQFEDVPIPSWASPSTGTDSTITIYRASTDQLWEFWKAYQDAAGWHACWGGRLDNVSTSPGTFANGFGTSATGIAGEAGDVSIADVRSGVIRHGIGLSIPSPATAKNFAWPAQRSDGASLSASAIPEGTRLRLDPSVNVDALHLSPIATMIAKAAQTYGFILINKSDGVAIAAESGAPAKVATGVNPWPTLLGGVPCYRVLSGFPWDKLQVVQRDYGRQS